MTKTFEFRPAPLAPVRTLEISDKGFVMTSRDETHELAFDEISRARFWSMMVQHHEFVGLDFTSKAGAGFRLRMNFSEFQSMDSHARRAFMGMLACCLEAVHGARPDVEVVLGQKNGVRWSLFALGVLCVGAAAVISLLALSEGRSARLGQAFAPLALMFVFGGTLMWSFRPFRAPDLLEAGTLAKMIRIAGNVPEDDL